MRRLNPYRCREAPFYVRWLLREGKGIAGLSRAAAWFFKRFRPVRSLPPYLSEGETAWRPGRARHQPPAEECFGEVRRLSAEGRRPSAVEISLATRSLRMTSPFRWDADGADAEDVLALHRFGWVFPALRQNPTQGCALFFWDRVLEWIGAAPSRPGSAAWEPYSMSERAVNWLLLVCLLKRSGAGGLPEEPRVRQSLERHGQELLARLEYYGEKDRTNNHLINNGRALYVLGAFFGDGRWQEAGRRILKEEASRSFTPGGVLREGSVHYHFLLLRTYSEMERAARAAGDGPFAEWTGAFAARLREAARFFLGGPDAPLPLLGDLSPDAPPEWLRSAAGGAPDGWAWLWGDAGKKEDFPQASPGFQDRRADGWARYDAPAYRVFWRLPPEGRAPGHFHAHHDAGAFELHAGGRPALVDGGRSTYEPDPFGLYGKSARSHNSCLVDGCEPFVSDGLNGGPHLLPEYGRGGMETDWEPSAQGGLLTLRHDGFSRLPGAGGYRRSFRLERNHILLEDRFEGRGVHRVETFFHAPPGEDVRREGGAFVAGPVRLIPEETSLGGEVLKGGWLGAYPAGWHASRYGRRVPSPVIRFFRRAAFPLANRFRIEVV